MNIGTYTLVHIICWICLYFLTINHCNSHWNPNTMTIQLFHKVAQNILSKKDIHLKTDWELWERSCDLIKLKVNITDKKLSKENRISQLYLDLLKEEWKKGGFNTLKISSFSFMDICQIFIFVIRVETPYTLFTMITHELSTYLDLQKEV